jgi:hypothetical protein
VTAIKHLRIGTVVGVIDRMEFRKVDVNTVRISKVWINWVMLSVPLGAADPSNWSWAIYRERARGRGKLDACVIHLSLSIFHMDQLP